MWDLGGAGLVGVELWWEVGGKCGDVGGWLLTGLIYGGNIYLKQPTFYFDFFLHTSMREQDSLFGK